MAPHVIYKAVFSDRSSACFHRASRLARRSCLNESDEEERVRGMCFDYHRVSKAYNCTVAISMTICELATAQRYSIPQECAVFSLGADDHIADGDVSSRCVG